MRDHVLALVESNTTGTGRLFAAAARERGHRPVLLAAAPERYPWATTDGVTVVRADTSDVEAALVALRDAGAACVSGVLTSSEYFVEVAARMAARLGLPGPPPDAVTRCRDKRMQRAVLRSAGISVPSFAVAEDPSEAVRAADDLGYPVVCKPVDGTGSRGVRLCHDRPAVRDHVGALLRATRDERGRPALPAVLVEEYVGGPEVSVETLGLRPVSLADKHLGPPPAFVEYGHDVPCTRRQPEQEACARVAVAALGALGLDWGPAHTEVRLAPAGPVVIEVNPRLAGGQIPVLVRLATGIDLIDATVAAATGDPAPSLAVGPGAASIRFLVAEEPARVGEVAGLLDAADVPGVVDVTVTASSGMTVGGTGSFLDRIGWVIAAGPTLPAARAAADEAITHLRIEPTDRVGVNVP